MPPRHTSVDVSGHRLEVGRSGGTRISAHEVAETSAAVADALKHRPLRSNPAAGDDDESAVVERTAEATELLTALIDESAFARAEAIPQLDQMLTMLQRLDRAGRHEEALRLARAVSGPLLLLQRWGELIDALGAAQQAAVEFPRFSGHLTRRARWARKDGVQRAQDPTRVSAGVPP